jgi:hypothetical protein
MEIKKEEWRLKGLCHKIFDLWFFHQTTSSFFEYRFEFAEIFDYETANFWLVVSIIQPLKYRSKIS